MSGRKIEEFLTHLAGQEDVAASTHNQAINAILFLDKEILKQELDLGFLNNLFNRWQEIKKWLKWELFSDLDDLREALKNILNKLSQAVVMSLSNPDFIKRALCVAGI